MTGLSLYMLAEAYQRIQDADDDGFEAALADLEDAIDAKADGVARVIRSLDAEAEVLMAEAKRLTDKAKARANRADGLKAYLLSNLVAVGLKQVKGPLFTVAVQDSPPSLNVLDREAIPDAYRVLPPPPTWRPDAKAIIDAVKRGETVPGAEIVIGKHLRIR